MRLAVGLVVEVCDHYTVITALAFMIIVNKKNAVPYCQQALFIVKVFIECLLHCLLNIRDAFSMS